MLKCVCSLKTIKGLLENVNEQTAPYMVRGTQQQMNQGQAQVRESKESVSPLSMTLRAVGGIYENFVQ